MYRKGNDQVRFEDRKTLDPSIKVIAPWRRWI
ncbi:MAG: argininosuccinate synthase domain-containing protein [Paeniclostridium sp.]